MHAWLCENPVGVEALQWKELPTPEPKAGEVRIAILGAAVVSTIATGLHTLQFSNRVICMPTGRLLLLALKLAPLRRPLAADARHTPPRTH